ncbi:MAG: hypothetical protein WB930_10730 [Syntrophobacteraceae bacterium]
MKKLTSLVKAFALQSGAQVVGIASAEIMNQHALEGQKPEQNLPDAKAVISFGIRMLDSIFKTPNVRISRLSYMYLHDALDKTAWKMATQLEDMGFDAIPMPSLGPVEMMEKGGIVGDISLRHAAVQAGLGRIGLSHHLLHPDFGPRLRLGCVITTAPLIADEPIKDEICLGEKCSSCVKSCPGEALKKRFGLKGCLSVTHKYNLYGLLKQINKIMDTNDPEEKKRLIFDRTISEVYMSLRTGDPPFCIKCVEVCPIGKSRSISVRSKGGLS